MIEILWWIEWGITVLKLEMMRFRLWLATKLLLLSVKISGTKLPHE